MKVTFSELSDQRRAVLVRRTDGTSETVALNSRSLLRHGLAHVAVELELGLTAGVWGSVAAGGSLAGDGLDGDDTALAETVSGPMKTMMRTGARPEEIHEVLDASPPPSPRRTSPNAFTSTL